tara:strand:- start:355 stop:678 length:324 start_codon:yes stop_codon:yes gene_type:complete
METLKTNDILSSSWGYEQTNINFYRVKRLVGKTMIELARLESMQVENQDLHFTQTSVIPDLTRERKRTFKRKIHQGTKSPFVMISNYESAWLWNGKPEEETNSLFGH